jgi:hypothetical protein
MAKAKIADVQKDMQNRESLATATDFDVEDAEIGKKASN